LTTALVRRQFLACCAIGAEPPSHPPTFARRRPDRFLVGSDFKLAQGPRPDLVHAGLLRPALPAADLPCQAPGAISPVRCFPSFSSRALISRSSLGRCGSRVGRTVIT
jgi:hypothetical protein